MSLRKVVISNYEICIFKITKTLCMKHIFFLLFLFTCFVSKTFSQEFQVPENVILNTKEDYVNSEKDVINAAKWLETTQLGKEMDKRVRVNAFVLMWLTGSSTVTAEVNNFCTSLTDKNPHLLGVFLASYARYALENNYSKDKLKGTTAAIKGMINCYKLGGEAKKNKLLDKAIAADKSGTLEEWVKENIDKNNE